MVTKSSVRHPCDSSSYIIASGVLYTLLNFWGVFRIPVILFYAFDLFDIFDLLDLVYDMFNIGAIPT